MSAHTQTEHHTTLGLDHRKLGFWVFLASECVFFMSLIITFIIYSGRPQEGPTHEVLNIPLTAFNTFVLLTSSLSMVLAVDATRRGDKRQMQLWLLATILMGSFFIGVQVFEYRELMHEGLTLTSNLFGMSFYLLTGFHGAHVTFGILWLIVVFIKSFGGTFGPHNDVPVDVMGLYWHFVDLVWVFLFPIVYLIKW
ncbi:MAG: heme-copper oxidase subunit III [Ardenticatenia bacterium]|nr:MAG: heme-copper oxidase subunit III [Ardenticatenia bacterium]